MRHRRIAAFAGAAVLAAGLYAAPANAQAAEGLAEFETSGSRLSIDAPAELATVPSVVPEREDFAFLGDAGDLVWVAGTVDGQTFPMLDAREADADVAVSLVKAEGPGEAWLYTFEGAGFAAPLASTADSTTFTLTAGTSTPVVLAVDEPGQYTLELVAQQDGERQNSAAPTGHGQAATAAKATYSVTAEEATVAEARSIANDGDANTGGAQADATCTVISDGHIDIGPRFVDGTWTAQLRDDTGSESVWRELEDVVLQVPDAALFPIPEGDFGFLGEPGQDIYMLPQVQASGIVWPGWNTQDRSVIDGVPGAVDWNLTEVDGPGDFTIFLTGTFGGADILFNSAEALPQTVSIPRNTHAHGNWTFSEPGVYRLTVEFTATTGEGETVTDTKDIQLAVGDAADTNAACSGDGGSGDGSGSGSGDKDDDGGFLPTTGTGWLLWGLGAAAIAVVIGIVIMVATRKRRNTSGTEPTGETDAS